MRRLIYKEDRQMYFYTPVIFETDADITVKEMGMISIRAQRPRASTHFDEFKKAMNKHGYIVNEIERLEKNTIPKDNTLEIVIGAMGNY